MTKKYSTKKALLASALSLLLCVSMLVGTTFAWFTDSVTSANNIIMAGNLDVELEYSTDMVNWTAVDANTNVFKEGALWEPGYTEVVYLRVSNVGSLAMKYKLGVNVASETEGKTRDNNTPFKLSDYIEYGIIKNVTAAYGTDDRMTARADIGTASKLNVAYSEEFHLVGKTATATDTDVYALVVYMPESVGNEANHNGTDIPVINLGLSVLATQDTVEEDSFNDQYDKDATYTISVNSTNELVSSFENMTEATVFDATGVSLNIDTIGTTTDEIIVPTFSIPTGATVKGAEFKIESNSMISAEATAVSDTVVFDECDIVTADADVTDGMPAMAIVGEMGTSVSSTKYVFNNCTFEGYIMLNGINAEFNNCTFVLSNENDGATYCSFGEYVFNNCTFNYENGTNLIASNTIYADSYATVVLNDCTLVGATYGNSANSTITVE